MTFVRNAWYVAAWSEEIGTRPMRRTILEEDLVFYRTGSGEAVALADRCAHRAYPLSAGLVSGDRIQCGYHGFEYDPAGICVKVPGQERIPRRTAVRAYPVRESHRWVWIWPGDPELAQSTPVPDTHWMTDPAWDRVTHTRLFHCNAQLLHDNLLDLTHEAFLHQSSIGDEAVYRNGVTVEVADTVVSVDRFMPSCHPSPLFEQATGMTLVDRWHTTEFQLPSVHIIHAGVVEPGGERENGYLLEVLNGITPSTSTTSWYFYAFCRNFAVGDQPLKALLSKSLGTVLTEDEDALALQQRGMEGRPTSTADILIAQDAGVAKARRLMIKMVAAEAGPVGVAGAAVVAGTRDAAGRP